MVVLSIFLTTTSLFNFCSLNLFFAAIFLFINISIVLLSKSTFTVTLSCISTFSIPISSYISLNILNIFLTSLYLFFSYTVLFGTPVYALPCYVFFFMGRTITPQFHYSFFFPVLYSRHKILLLSCSSTLLPIVSFFLHFVYCTFVISPLLAFSSLQFHAFWQRSHHIFFTCLSRRNSCSQFSWV